MKSTRLAAAQNRAAQCPRSWPPHGKARRSTQQQRPRNFDAYGQSAQRIEPVPLKRVIFIPEHWATKRIVPTKGLPVRGIGRLLTNPSRYTPAHMTNEWIELHEQQELIASFGGAEIVKHLDGRLEIRGRDRGRASPSKSLDAAVLGKDSRLLSACSQIIFAA